MRRVDLARHYPTLLHAPPRGTQGTVSPRGLEVTADKMHIPMLGAIRFD
jgi:hypothetical protein